MTEQNPMNEKMRAINFRMTKERFRLKDEFRLVPRWLVRLMLALFIAAEVLGQALIAVGERPWPELEPFVNSAGLAGIIAGVSLVVSALVFLVGYVNRDAQRRGMNVTLWTLLVIFVPDAIGFILYFLLREPLQFHCPHCGALVSARFNFCPSCKYNLHPACPHCGREVRPEDRYCAQCAYDLTATAGTAAVKGGNG